MKKCGIRQTSETTILRAIQGALKLEPGLMLMRNSVCKRGGYAYGLGPGSADLVGLLRGINGFPSGRFIALEVKNATGTPSDEQLRWLRSVRMHCGFACIVRSVAEAREAIARARKGELQ